MVKDRVTSYTTDPCVSLIGDGCCGVDHLDDGNTEVDPEAIHVDKAQAAHDCDHVSRWNAGKAVLPPHPAEEAPAPFESPCKETQGGVGAIFVQPTFALDGILDKWHLFIHDIQDFQENADHAHTKIRRPRPLSQ